MFEPLFEETDVWRRKRRRPFQKLHLVFVDRLSESCFAVLTNVVSLQNSHQVATDPRSHFGFHSFISVSTKTKPGKKRKKNPIFNSTACAFKGSVATNPENVSMLQTAASQPNACTTAAIDPDKEINIHKDD